MTDASLFLEQVQFGVDFLKRNVVGSESPGFSLCCAERLFSQRLSGPFLNFLKC